MQSLASLSKLFIEHLIKIGLSKFWTGAQSGKVNKFPKVIEASEFLPSFPPFPWAVQCMVYSIQCALYSGPFTVHSFWCTVYSVKLELYSVQCAVYIVQ